MSTHFRTRGVRLLIVITIVTAVAGTACEKTAVKSSVSPCFRVLPQAHEAVGSQGTFVDVARREGTSIYPGSGGPAITRAPQTSPTTGVIGGLGRGVHGAGGLDPNDPRLDVCIIAYRGTFDAARVQDLRGPNRSGRYAVVFIGVRSQQVRAVILTDRLPPALHRH